jgi:microcystin degradation protein MlrC
MKRLRIAVAGLWHETNTFSSVAADFDAFAKDTLVRGEELIAAYEGSNATIAGFLDAARDFAFDAIPLLHARAGPIGTITADAYDRIVEEILQGLRNNGPWDAVLLANHGAAVSESFADADGAMAAQVRATIGPDVPFGIALDLHANLTPALVHNTTVINAYQTNPHLDARTRGYACADLIVRTARGELAPVQWLEQPPLVINIVRQWTGEAPMTELLGHAQDVSRWPGIVATNVVQGYPYADVAELGMSFHAIAHRDLALAQRAARAMADRAWSNREEMRSNLASIEQTLALAQRLSTTSSGRPVVLMDVGDNVLGGSSADSTVLLTLARQRGLRGLLQTVFDPDSVARSIGGGVGNRITLRIGAKTDQHHGVPLEVSAIIRAIGDGTYSDDGPTHGGFQHFDDGQRALLETDDGHTVLLTSNRASNLSREQWYSIGVRPEDHPIIIAKGVVSPRPAYEPIASQILLADTPGLTTANLDALPYQHRRRPLFPFEPDATYPTSTH